MSQLLIATTARRARGVRAPYWRMGALTEFATQIVSGADDASEFLDTGEMVLADDQVPLGHSTADHRVVMSGARFQSVPLAQGEEVAFARLKFTSRYYNATDLGVLIRAHAIAHAPAFTSAAGDLSGRPLTSASVLWVPPYWYENQYDADTWTPNVGAIAQAVISDPAWVSGNAIAFVFTKDDATTPSVGRRFFISFESDPDRAARLEANTVEDEPPPPAPPPTEGDYDYVGDPDFTASSLDALGGTVRSDYDNVITDIFHGASVAQLRSWASTDNSIWISRTLHSALSCVLAVFRVTGDLRLLDQVASIMQDLYGLLVWSRGKGWRLGHPESGSWSEYLMVVWDQSGTVVHGTDGKNNDIKIAALIAHVAWALHKNRHLSLESPAGMNYDALADQWLEYLLGTGAHGQVGGRAPEGYMAKINHPRWSKPSGVWGMEFIEPNHDPHGWLDWMKFHYYMSLLDPSEARHWPEAERLANIWWKWQSSAPNSAYPSSWPADGGSVEVRFASTPVGPAAVWRGTVLFAQSSRDYLQMTNYTSNMWHNAVHHHLDGYREWRDTDFMRAQARGIQQFQFTHNDGTVYTTHQEGADSGLNRDMGGGFTRAGISPSPDNASHPRRGHQQQSHPIMAAWDSTGMIEGVYRVRRSQTFGTSDANSSGGTIRMSCGVFLSTYFGVVGLPVIPDPE